MHACMHMHVYACSLGSGHEALLDEVDEYALQLLRRRRRDLTQ